MMTANKLYDVGTVPLGLCNGTRGVVRGFKYSRDEHELKYIVVQFGDRAMGHIASFKNMTFCILRQIQILGNPKKRFYDRPKMQAFCS